MLNLNSILLFSEKPVELSKFYEKVVGKGPDFAEGEYRGFSVGSSFLVIGPHDKVKGANLSPERILLNFETADVNGEFARIRELGARVVAEPYAMEGGDPGRIATFADPDGNFFQLVSPMK